MASLPKNLILAPKFSYSAYMKTEVDKELTPRTNRKLLDRMNNKSQRDADLKQIVRAQI